jgi:hypothetical protein
VLLACHRQEGVAPVHQVARHQAVGVLGADLIK